MKIYQPLLYLGLGGTGCLIGAELERRLRDELCGADGTRLQGVIKTKPMLPFQLPSCVQFVYADLNEAELNQIRQQVVPGDEHLVAADRTMHLVRNLVPNHHSYPQAARSLRTNAPDFIEDWLPPPLREPRVAPLVRGAGQLPTVGRAALFETLRDGIEPAIKPVTDAIGRINNSVDELASLDGRFENSCDVFVAFSVAGGTGAGVFYDYLHLVAEAFQRAGYRARIYPLVLMPSAFDEGMGGGRSAVLNSGRALLDLFRLVDDQNGGPAGTQLDGMGVTGQLGVRYPKNGKINIHTSTIQTAFLFSRPTGVTKADLCRSVVSLITSLVGADLEKRGEASVEDTYQSFADSFINRSAERQTPAPSGIGNRGVSTGLVASMTVPVDDLAGILSSHLLARGVAELLVPPPGRAESNRQLIMQLFAATNLEELRTRAAVSPGISDPPEVSGAEPIMNALRDRVNDMEDNLRTLENNLIKSVPEMVKRFDPRRGIGVLLADVDPFRLQRALVGHDRLDDPIDKRGFRGQLEDRRREPTPKYPELGVNPPQLPMLKDPVFGRKSRMSSPAVQQSIDEQDDWYEWRTYRTWNAAWAEQTPVWERRLNQMTSELDTLVQVLRTHSEQEPERFRRRIDDLYRPRVGVSYLLPVQSDFEGFYAATLRRFLDERQLPPMTTEGGLLNILVGKEGWQNAFVRSWESGPEAALNLLRTELKQAVKQLIRESGAGGEQPLLPALGDLLAAASDGGHAHGIGEDDLKQFQQKLAGLVPGTFKPKGTGRLKILISYPIGAQGGRPEAYLRDHIQLPSERSQIEFRAVEAESIVVVFFRTSMSVTEVPELREVLQSWAEALHDPKTQDYLPWRQRLGYGSGWLATSHEHRVAITHRLLCAMWNDHVTVVEGDPGNPGTIKVQLGRRDAVSMVLDLNPYEHASSWGSIVRAYEEWTLADDQDIRRDFCGQLMQAKPLGLEKTPQPPGKIYRTIRSIAADQAMLLETLRDRLPEERRGWADQLHEFWTRTFPEALDLPFESDRAVRVSLRELEGFHL